MERLCPECSQPTAETTCPVHGCPTVLRVADESPLRLVGQTFGGRYLLTAILGEGGFGTVFRATHTSTRQEVVVKVLKPEFSKDPVHIQRFLNEGRAASCLNHPNTVRVFDFGQTDDAHLYLAMELLNGRELSRVLRDVGRMEPLRAVHIAIGVLKSLAEAHQSGIVHRDLKPDNVFLCRIHGEDDFVKLIDFGIAKSYQSADQDLTAAGFAVGTPKYMSPEQARAESLDGRADLYALGIILYEMLSGTVPFHAASAMATMVKHLQEPPRPLPEACDLPLPAGLPDVVHIALRKSRDARYRDAEDMRAALERVLEGAGEPVSPTGRARSAEERGLQPPPASEFAPTLELPRVPVSPAPAVLTMAAPPQPAVSPTPPPVEVVPPKPLPPAQPSPRRRRQSTWSDWVLPVGMLVVMGAAGTAAWWLLQQDPNQPASQSERIQGLANRVTGLMDDWARKTAAPPTAAPTQPEPETKRAGGHKPSSRKDKASRLLDRADVIAATRLSVRKCLGAEADPQKSAGKVTVEVRVGEDGVADRVRSRAEPENQALAACLQRAFADLHLAEPAGDATYEFPAP
ncbi:MAG: serine/threonine protein kinase [Myxococcota bacterium]